jgi:regulator of nucleoside diphosphate kinase
MHQSELDTSARPPIAIEECHYARLSALALSMKGAKDVCEYLGEELDRARILPPGEWNPSVVSLGSKVKFRDEHTGRIHELILVYPFEANIEHRRVSVMTPVGAALLGLSANQTISFCNTAGEPRKLTVIDVSEPEQP